MSAPTTINLELQLDDDTAQGLYANMAMVNHTDTEFALDFIYVQPQQPRGRVRARVLASPRLARRLLTALAENIAKYEARFGAIDAGVPEDGDPDLH